MMVNKVFLKGEAHVDVMFQERRESNLDPSISTWYVNTEHQVADVLAKGSVTTDTWNELLLFFWNGVRREALFFSLSSHCFCQSLK